MGRTGLMAPRESTSPSTAPLFLPLSMVTEGEAHVALVNAGMPTAAAAVLAQAARECEAPAGDGVHIALDAVGDDGLALGPFQVRVDQHQWAAGLDLYALDVSAAAAVVIWREAGGLGPWACVP